MEDEYEGRVRELEEEHETEIQEAPKENERLVQQLYQFIESLQAKIQLLEGRQDSGWNAIESQSGKLVCLAPQSPIDAIEEGIVAASDANVSDYRNGLTIDLTTIPDSEAGSQDDNEARQNNSDATTVDIYGNVDMDSRDCRDTDNTTFKTFETAFYDNTTTSTDPNAWEMESTEPVNEVLQAAFHLAASQQEDLLWDITVQSDDYSSYKTKILDSASKLPEPSQSSQKPIKVFGLQPRFSDLESSLREILSGITDSGYPTVHLATFAERAKKLDFFSLAISEIAWRGDKCDLRAPEQLVGMGDLPGLLSYTIIWGEAIESFKLQEMSLPCHSQDRPTPEPWTADEVKGNLMN